MRLTKKALKMIDDQKIRLLLALALGCGEMTIRRYIDANHENLTKAASLAVIRKATGLTDKEILEKEIVQA